MTDTLVSAETLVAAFLATQEFYVNDSGVDGKANGQQVADFVGCTLRNASSADQSVTASTDTILTGSRINIPAAGLRVGTRFRYRVFMAKNANGTVAPIFKFRLGTAGTTADAAIITINFTTAGTAAADQAEVDIDIVLRSVGSGTAAVAVGVGKLVHNLASTGWALTADVLPAAVVSTGFNSTTANLIATLALTPGASYVTTVNLVMAEAVNL